MAKFYLITNLSNGPRDYPLKDGSSIYLKARSKNAGSVKINDTDMSDALQLAAKKKLIKIGEVNE